MLRIEFLNSKMVDLGQMDGGNCHNLLLEDGIMVVPLMWTAKTTLSVSLHYVLKERFFCNIYLGFVGNCWMEW